MVQHPPTPHDPSDDATELLIRIGGGDAGAVDELLPLVYDQLRAIAARSFRGQPAEHTLQPTALVHEAFLKMIRNPDAQWKNSGHFFAVAATAMRQILTDHARGKARAKRGGDVEHVSLGQVESPSGNETLDILDLERALTRLAGLDERQARIIELWFFAGLTVDEIAGILDVSPRTIRRDWTHARAWLNRELAGTGSS